MTDAEKAALAAMMQNADLSTFQPSSMPNPYVSAFHRTNQQINQQFIAPLMRWLTPSYQTQQAGTNAWWMPQNVAAREQPVPVATAPPTNAWADIEGQASKEQDIADQLGTAGKAILNSPITTGDWW